MLDARGEARCEPTDAGRFHAAQDLRCDLQVPGVVGVADLEHGTCCRLGVAAALDRHVGEERLALGGAPVVRVHLRGDRVLRAQLGDHVRARADRCEVLIGAGLRGRADAVGELGLLDDRARVADERHERVRLGRLERDRDGVVVVGHHAGDVTERLVRATGLFVDAVLVGEHDVRGGERRAVRPHHVVTQRPRDLREVVGDAVTRARDRRGECRDDRPVGRILGERLAHERAGEQVLRAAREQRVGLRRCLPLEQHDLAAGAGGAARGRLVAGVVRHVVTGVLGHVLRHLLAGVLRHLLAGVFRHLLAGVGVVGRFDGLGLIGVVTAAGTGDHRQRSGSC